LLKAFSIIVATENLQLVLVAPKTEGYAELCRLAAELGISARLVFTDRITDEGVMKALYSGAEAFVMPSLYEGFGLPPVEAMACGTPVVCSQVTSLPEVVGDAAVLIDATNPDEVARAVITVLKDGVLKKGMVRQGFLRAAEFSENAVSRRMFDFLRDIAG
jgi:glycosyltransferase involved in cell wall biosynthesis